MKNKRGQKIEELINANGSASLSARHRNIYLQRLYLKLPFKNGGASTFYEQFQSGDGKELKDHFWRTYSSSRLCFEFFSWMVGEEDVDDLVFEKKLPGIKYSPKKPNMDVYLQKGNVFYFVESKFTEKSVGVKLADSYYKEKGVAMGSHGPIGSLLKDRYYNTGFELAVIKFYEEVLQKTTTQDKPLWLDIPQEIKHTIGLFFEIINDLEKYNGKDIVFVNLFYDFQDGNDGFAHYFYDTLQSVMREELQKRGFSGTYSYYYKTYQEALKSLPEKPAYGADKIEKMHGSTNLRLINMFVNSDPLDW